MVMQVAAAAMADMAAPAAELGLALGSNVTALTDPLGPFLLQKKEFCAHFCRRHANIRFLTSHTERTFDSLSCRFALSLLLLGCLILCENVPRLHDKAFRLLWFELVPDV